MSTFAFAIIVGPSSLSVVLETLPTRVRRGKLEHVGTRGTLPPSRRRRGRRGRTSISFAHVARQTRPGRPRSPSGGSPCVMPARCAASTLSLQRPPIGSTWPVSVISPVIATVLRDRPFIASEASAVAIAMPAEAAVLRHRASRARGCARRARANQSSLEPEICVAVPAHPGERRLRGLPHDVSELAR